MLQIRAKPLAEMEELSWPLDVLAPHLQDLVVKHVRLLPKTTLPSSLETLDYLTDIAPLLPALRRCKVLRALQAPGEFPTAEFVDRWWPGLEWVCWQNPCSTTDRHLLELQKTRPNMCVAYVILPSSIQRSLLKLQHLILDHWDPKDELPWSRWSASIVHIQAKLGEVFDFARVKEEDLLGAGVQQLNIAALASSLSPSSGSRFTWEVLPGPRHGLLHVKLVWVRG